MISSRPMMNSARLRQRLSGLYASATRSGSRVFQPSSAARTFWIAVASVNGGSGGRISAPTASGLLKRAMTCHLQWLGYHAIPKQSRPAAVSRNSRIGGLRRILEPPVV